VSAARLPTRATAGSLSPEFATTVRSGKGPPLAAVAVVDEVPVDPLRVGRAGRALPVEGEADVDARRERGLAAGSSARRRGTSITRSESLNQIWGPRIGRRRRRRRSGRSRRRPGLVPRHRAAPVTEGAGRGTGTQAPDASSQAQWLKGPTHEAEGSEARRAGRKGRCRCRAGPPRRDRGHHRGSGSRSVRRGRARRRRTRSWRAQAGHHEGGIPVGSRRGLAQAMVTGRREVRVAARPGRAVPERGVERDLGRRRVPPDHTAPDGRVSQDVRARVGRTEVPCLRGR